MHDNMPRRTYQILSSREFVVNYTIYIFCSTVINHIRMCENNCENFNVNVHNTPDESLFKTASCWLQSIG